MDLSYTAEQDGFREELRGWLAENIPREPLPSLDTRDGFDAHRAWERRLAEARWSAVSWPEEYGGRGAGLIEWLIFEEEYWGANAPNRVNQNGVFLLGPVLLEFGTPEQKRDLLPKIASSETVWCQGWSEPDSGSDLASLRARAERDGDEWVLNGQKTWCSRGVFADAMFGLFRSDPGSERHHGLSFILVPLDTPGVTVRPINQLDGEAGFAEVFLDDVRVPADAGTIGGPGDGWKITMSTVGFERGVVLRSPGRFAARASRLANLYRQVGHLAAPAASNEVTRAWMDAEAYRLFTLWTVQRILDGGSVGAESSLNKLFWSEMDVRMHEAALRLAGTKAELMPDAPGAIDDGAWMDGYLFSLAGPIYAGTNEIQRNIVAERVLGLPRG